MVRDRAKTIEPTGPSAVTSGSTHADLAPRAFNVWTTASYWPSGSRSSMTVAVPVRGAGVTSVAMGDRVPPGAASVTV
jgi:hypothetical protein